MFSFKFKVEMAIRDGLEWLGNISPVVVVVTSLLCTFLVLGLRTHYHEDERRGQIAPGLTYERRYEPSLKTWIALLRVNLGKVEPVVVTSSRGMTERDPLTTLAAGDTYVAAVNGDFFNPDGRPEGLVLSEGRMLLAPNGNSGICFSRDGRASIKRWAFSENAQAVIGDDRYPFAGNALNRPFVTGRLGVYSLSPFAQGAGQGRLAQAVFRATEHSQNRLVGRLVNSAFQPSQNLPIPPGHFALVASNHPSFPEREGPYGWAKRTWKPGATVTISLPTHPSLEQEWTVLTGGPELLRFSELVVDADGNANGTLPDARTMIGISADGRQITVLVAERYAKGWTYEWGPAFGGWLVEHILAARRRSEGVNFIDGALFLRRLGCTAVLNLDGGGSSEMVVRLKGNLQILNRPTEGRERPLPNALAFRRR